MALRLLSESTIEPLTLDEIKHYCRLSTSDTSEDTLLLSMQKAARIEAETKCHRSFVAKQYKYTLDYFPSGGIELPDPPLSTVAGSLKINYIDLTGTEATMASTSLVVDTETEPGMVFPSTVDDWPDANDVVNAVSVTYETTSAPTDNIKIWIGFRTASLYENRQKYVEGKAIGEINFDGLLDSQRLPEVR